MNWCKISRVSSHRANLDVTKFWAPNSLGKGSPWGKIFIDNSTRVDTATEHPNLAW